MDQLKLSPANSCPLTPLNFLERTATIYGDCTSVVYNGTAYTWSETHRRCLRLASAIVGLGVERGQVVSVMAPNIPAMYEMNFAVPMAGAVLNSINLRLDARTVSIMLRHCESKVIFVDCLSKDVLMEALSMFPAESPRPALVLITDEEFPTERGREFVDTYEGLIEKGDPGFNWIRPRSELDPIVLNYTSGTTSAPKGVVHSHRGAFLMTLDSLNQWPMPKQPVYLWTLAMFHANGWSYTWGMAAVGAANICLRKFDAAVIYAAIKNHHVTHMCGAPVVLNMLSNFPGVKPLSQPVYIMTAGAPPPAAVLFRTESLGFVVSHGYGLTETGGLVVSCTWKNKWNKFPAEEKAKLKARQGVRTIAMTEVDVVDPDTGRSVKRDGATLGEVVFKGGCIMLGYLKDPEGTAKCLKPDGWFYTGDVGVMHPDGYLEIKDRSKDVIISGGENLSSVEVESVLYMHPAVNEAAVVARPDEFWGETPCAFLSLKAGVTKKPTEKEIMEFCRARMPHFMVPKTVVFQDDLPKTSTGKIQKFLLRETAKAMGSSKLQRKSRM
ncbi:PREDICTED: probable acyl-activating enzyme 5, peroxisomal [Ipomoea nil]|uniref:probable acyl-activating enzyme 5, peroxisomal n=1 Tax=Ipomoea nil TaxID=35883 RepID=UPI0009018086|nr:PREDICTED: probable acyl-activating enzyme 5, peroxisomal [Ipomoea nil]